MKAYTITCHNVYNAGASLQAYALYKYLNNIGIDTVIIDYTPDYLSRHYSFFEVSEKYKKNILLKIIYLIAKFPRRLFQFYSKKKYRFDKFRKKYLKLTEKNYKTNDELKYNLPRRDIYFSGSDQIWNTFFSNGKDPAFYLDFAPSDSIKASYAASMASKEINCDFVDFFKTKVSRLDFISVREPSSIEVIENLGIKNIYEVMDPVFLLTREEWDRLAEKSSFISKDKYLLVYDFDNNKEISQFCQKVAKEKNIKIYSFFKNSYADLVVDFYGPIEFLSLIKNSEFVVSNSFHGTALSILYEKDFVVFDRKENLNLRMDDLLSRFDLKERKFNASAILDNKIDYVEVNKKLDLYILESKNYIDKCIGKQNNS